MSTIMINQIHIIDDTSEFIILDEKTDLPQKTLTLKKFNIFIGPNNSGKSRFMRSIILKNLNGELKFNYSSIFKKICVLNEYLIKNYPNAFNLNEIGITDYIDKCHSINDTNEFLKK